MKSQWKWYLRFPPLISLTQIMMVLETLQILLKLVPHLVVMFRTIQIVMTMTQMNSLDKLGTKMQMGMTTETELPKPLALALLIISLPMS